MVFDLGNVIVPWERRRALEQFVDDPTEVERLADEVFTMEVNHLLDLGHPLEVIRAEIESAHPGHGWVIDSYVEHFGHSLGPVIEGSVTLVDDLLNAGVRCAGLTNWSAICWRRDPRDDSRCSDASKASSCPASSASASPTRRSSTTSRSGSGCTATSSSSSTTTLPTSRRREPLGWHAEVFTTPEQARADVVRAGLLDR